MPISNAGFKRIAQAVLPSRKAQQLDSFTRQYVETALWSSVGEGEDGEITDEHSFSDISPETMQSMIEDCAKFQQENAQLLSEAYEATGEDDSKAGHDFWLTRNHHGAGFWDGDWRTPERDFGKELTTAAKRYSEVNLYVGDDGMIYG